MLTYVVGAYIAGPIVGRIVDTHGPRIPLMGAFVCCLAGYAGIKCMFDGGVAAGGTLSSGHFAMLVLCSSFTGFGAIGGVSSAINTTAKSFPPSMVCYFLPLSAEHCVSEHQ